MKNLSPLDSNRLAQAGESIIRHLGGIVALAALDLALGIVGGEI